eukprot:1638736-Amphidinium_carterae.1
MKVDGTLLNGSSFIDIFKFKKTSTLRVYDIESRRTESCRRKCDSISLYKWSASITANNLMPSRARGGVLNVYAADGFH